MIPRKASRRPLLSHRDPPGTHPTPENDPEGGQEGPLGSSTRTPETFIRMGAIRVGWVGERAGEAPGVPPYVRQLLLSTTHRSVSPTSLTHQPNPLCFETSSNIFHLLLSHIFSKFPSQSSSTCSTNIVSQIISSKSDQLISVFQRCDLKAHPAFFLSPLFSTYQTHLLLLGLILRPTYTPHPYILYDGLHFPNNRHHHHHQDDHHSLRPQLEVVKPTGSQHE